MTELQEENRENVLTAHPLQKKKSHCMFEKKGLATAVNEELIHHSMNITKQENYFP